MDTSKTEHIPVLSRELVEQVKLQKNAVIVDVTTGHGGHSYLFGQKLGPEGVIIGLDVDKNCIRGAQSRLNPLACKVVLIRANFTQISEQLHSQGIEKADLVLADLGLCSAQITDSQVGLSFLTDMPLDMRIDKRLTTTAADIVNKENEKNIADLIYKYGEDRASRRIARFIVEGRKHEPITTTGQLASIVCRALAHKGKKGRSRIHPATRTFQALRIAVNDELENLQKLLDLAPELLSAKGYIAIISYHSLEDRLVKNNFKHNKEKQIYELVTKKPVVPTEEEIAENPRARSAKLRIAKKV